MVLDVIIVGAGIAGLSAAVALRQAGHNVVVLEKHSNKREIGQGVSLPPNATRVLRSFGMDFKKARMSSWDGIDLVRADVEPMQVFAESDSGDSEQLYGAPSLSSYRVDLHDALRQLAVGDGKGAPVCIREGASVVSYDAEAGSVTLASGEVCKADLIVAADGIRSNAHAYILGEERPARFSGWSCVRFVVPTEQMKSHPELVKLLSKGEGRAAVYYGTGGKLGLFRSPCRDNTLQNFGVYFWSDEDPTSSDNYTTQSKREIALGKLSSFAEAIQGIPQYADEDGMYLWHIAERDPLPRFHRGRLVVIGDANHPMQSHIGQGATQAIEDAGVLGVVLSDRSNLAERLQLWEDLRKDRVSFIQLCSRAVLLAPWKLASETKKKAEGFWPNGEVPDSRPTVLEYCYRGDCLRDAAEAVHASVDGQAASTRAAST